jgi:hypothetical protein
MKRLLPILLFLSLTNVYSQTYQRDYNWLTPYQNSSDSVQVEHDPFHNRIFMCGMGTQMQEKWPSFTNLDATTFATFGNKLEVDGEILTAIPDGQGGFFIAGKFTKVNGQTRTYLAQIDANNQLTSFNPTITYFFPPNARIYALHIANNKLFIGGGISTVNGQTRQNLAAFDLPSGNLISWAPNPNNIITSIESVGNTVFVGGEFTQTSGNARNYIASYDASLTLTSWNPNPNGQVKSIKKGIDNLYITGYFSSFNGQSRSKLVQIETINFTPTSFNVPINNGMIFDLLEHQGQLYIAGLFSNVGGVSTSNFAAIDLVSQTVNASSLTTNDLINSIEYSNGTLLIGGLFTTVNNQGVKYFVELNLTSGAIDDKALALNNSVNKISSNGTHVMLSGNFDVLKQYPSNSINSFNAQTGQVLSSPVQTNGHVFKISIDGKYLSMLGDFTEVNGLPRNTIAIYDLQGDSLLPFSIPNPYLIDLTSANIQISDEELYVERQVYGSDDIIAIPIFNADSIRNVAGAYWDLNGNFGGIYNFNIIDSLVMINGIFNYINGQTRAAFGMVNKNTGEVHPLNLNLVYGTGNQIPQYPGHSTYDAALKDDTLFLAGQFDYSNAVPYQGIIAVDLGTNTVSQVSPNTGYFVGYDLDLKHDKLRICATPNFLEYDVSSATFNNSATILANQPSKINQFGSKIFASNLNDFGVYTTCDNSSLTTISTPCSYTWNGHVYTQSGYYQRELNGATSCDSTAYLDLTILNSESYLPVNYCGVQYTSSNGMIYNQSGLYYETYMNVYGCDSIVKLNLHIYPTYDTTIAVVTSGSQYNWVDIGQSYTTSGVYSHTFQTINGCDSIVHLNLNFVPLISYTTTTPNEQPVGEMQDLLLDSLNNVAIVGGSFTGFRQKADMLQQMITSTSPHVVWSKDSITNWYGPSYVSKVISDNNGGAYVFGGFNEIGDSVRNRICQVDANFHVTAWNFNQTNLNFIEQTVVADQNYLYILVENYPSDSIYKVDRLTGVKTALNIPLGFNDAVYSMAVINNHLLLGGVFMFNGTNGIINYNLATNTFVRVSVNASSYVGELHVDGNKVYAIGGFTQIASSTRNGLARFNYNSGSLVVDTWNPNPNGFIYDINTTPSKVIVTGSFTTIGGQSRNGTAALNKTANTASSFNPGFSLGQIYVFQDKVGFLSTIQNMNIGTNVRHYFAAFDTSSMTLSAYDLNLSSQGYNSFNVCNNQLVAYGIDYVGFQPKQAIAYYDMTSDQRITGPINFSDPNTQIVKMIKVGNTIYMSGSFYDPILAGYVSVAAFDYTTGSQIALPDPILSGVMLNASDDHIYFANATVASWTTLPVLTRLSISDNTIDYAFDINLTTTGWSSPSVADVEFDADTMYVAGYFSSILGQSRSSIAKLYGSNILDNDFQPTLSQDGSITEMELVNNELYISGYFDSINSTPTINVGRVNKINGQEIQWVNMAYGQVPKYLYKNYFVYMFGMFQTVNAENRRMFTNFQVNSIYPLELQYDSIYDPMNEVNQTKDLEVSENDVYGIFTGYNKNEYRVFRVCRDDLIVSDDNLVTNPYVWFGDTLSQSGVYYHTVSIPNACDSLYILNYTHHEDYIYDTMNIVSCAPYTWINGVIYTNSDTVSNYIVQNLAGDDTVFTLNLTILQATSATETVSTCDSYTWQINNQTYTSSGQYIDTIPNAAGCDSIIILDLTINHATTGTDFQTGCDSLTWIDGNTYTSTTNTPTFTLQNVAGCDSIITLDLTIIPDLPLTIENSFSMPSDANSCTGEIAVTVSGNADFELDFDNGSQILTSSGYSLVTNLCPGVHDLHVTDNCGDTLSVQVVIPVDSNFVFNNPFIDSLAQDSLGVTMTNCDIYYAGIDTAYIDSIWATGNTVNVIWNIVDSNGSNFDTTIYVLNNGNGVYWLQLSVFCPNKSLGEYFTVTEAIYFNNGTVSTAGTTNYKEALFEIYPNPTNDQVHINFSGSDAELTVYDLQGKVVLKDRIQNQGIVSLQNFERGVYLFDFKNSQGHSVQRVVKQ